MQTHNPRRNPNAPKNLLKPTTAAPAIIAVAERIKKGKGFEYSKISSSIPKIKNFYQVEPTRKLIDLFGKKYGDRVLQQELLNDLYEKAAEFASE